MESVEKSVCSNEWTEVVRRAKKSLVLKKIIKNLCRQSLGVSPTHPMPAGLSKMIELRVALELEDLDNALGC